MNDKLQKIIDSGLYNSGQIETIKYALHREGIDENVLLDPSISEDYMFMYIKLMEEQIDVRPFINNKWHNKGYPENELINIIRGYIKNPDLIKDYTNLSLDGSNNLKNKDLLEKLRDDVKFFLKSQSQFYNIDELLKTGIENFNLEQVGYLFAVFATGRDISDIFDSNLSVDQMKEIVLSSAQNKEQNVEVLDVSPVLSKK